MTEADQTLFRAATGGGETVLRTRPGEGDPIGPGTRLLNDKFEIEDRLGSGGMGVVYRAIDLEAARLNDPHARIALKVLSASIQTLPEAMLALQRECSRARRLAHTNIVRVYEFYQQGSGGFITMELLEGRSWDKLIREHAHGMPLAHAQPLIQQLLDAMMYAHAQGVAHSDLKPENLFLTGEDVVKVLDFGIAAPIRRAGPAGPETLYNPRRLGALSESYACLEMWQGLDADPRDDVYSIACIVYELLSGRHPYDRTTAAVAFDKQVSPAPLTALTPRQNDALRRGLRLVRRDRTASVQQFAQELFDGEDRGYKPRSWLLPVVAAAATVTLAGILVGPLFLNHPPHAPATAPPQAGLPGLKAIQLAQFLGLNDSLFKSNLQYSREEVLRGIASAPRRVVLGSTDSQVELALSICRQWSTECKREWYSDESSRQALLQPFALDPTAVTVQSFRAFVLATNYKTEAERAGGAYSVVNGSLRWLRGGSWMNAVSSTSASGETAVVAINFNDAQAFCSWRGMRLPSEDEWEYAARGPRGQIFPWGDDPSLASTPAETRPAAVDGPPEGDAGLYRGMSGNVWEWVNTRIRERLILKGGSWLEQNPANKRAAARRLELPGRADADSGFRCARSEPSWPDAGFWVDRLSQEALNASR
jgi:serine/threonine protein kinase